MLKRGIPAATLAATVLGIAFTFGSDAAFAQAATGRHLVRATGTLKQSVPLGQREQTVVLKMVGDPVAVVRSRGVKGFIAPERSGFTRDINFFLLAFFLAAVAMYVPHEQKWVRGIFSIALVSLYVIYVVMTFRASSDLVNDGHGTEAPGTMLLSRLGVPTNFVTIIVQLAIALGLLIWGAEGFIYGVQGMSHLMGISPLLLSLLIIPIATELPEKVNSILWIRRGKDTLAFGNITGAMVFQGTLLPAIGIMLTPWEPRIEVITGVVITLAAAACSGLSLLAFNSLTAPAGPRKWAR